MSDQKRRRTIKSICSDLKHSCVQRAKFGGRQSHDKKPLEFPAKVELTNQWIREQIEKGNKYNIPYDLENVGKACGESKCRRSGNPFSPSLDRIDSNNKDYTIDNVEVVPYGINVMRNNFEHKDIVILMKAYLKYHNEL